jgi:hypothetical protein
MMVEIGMAYVPFISGDKFQYNATSGEFGQSQPLLQGLLLCSCEKFADT